MSCLKATFVALTFVAATSYICIQIATEMAVKIGRGK